MVENMMEGTTSLLPVLLPLSAIFLVIRHRDWLQERLLGKNGLKEKLLPKSWYPGKSLSRDWYKDKAVLITGCDSGLGYRCADLNSAKFDGTFDGFGGTLHKGYG